MTDVLFWRVAGLSLACSAVLAPLLLASRLVRRRYAARTCYVLWLLLAMRLLLPFSAAPSDRVVTVEVPQYEIELAPQIHASSQTASAKTRTPVQTASQSDQTTRKPPAVSLTQILPGLWAAGMAGCGLWVALSYVLARSMLLRRAKPANAEDEALLNALREELACKQRALLCRSEQVNTPMLMGMVRPLVLLPAGELPEEELSIMLRHELTHLRRHDVAYKLCLQLVCIIHWFNPLVWWMSREAGRNLELCCDEDVVRGRDGAFRCAYGEILLKTAAGSGRAPVLSARMGGGKGYLKARLSNLFMKKKNGAVLVCVVLTAVILGGSLVSCNGEVPAEEQSEDWNDIVNIG